LFNLCEARASTTNFWVLNLNYALKAYVQSGNGVLVGTIATKQIINLLSGSTNLNNQVGIQTNLPVISVTVSNNPFLITNDAGSYVISSNYVLGTFTNNIDFTNDISFTEVTNEPLTYTFNNQVQVSSNQTLLLFPNLQTGPVTAVQSTNNPGIFTLSGIVTNTSPIQEVMPDFSKGKGARLIYVTPVVDVTNNLTPKFQVRYSVGGVVTNVDVSDFFFEPEGSTVRSTHPGSSTPQYGLRLITFDSTFLQQTFFGEIPQQPGATLIMIGFDQQTRAAITSKGKSAAADVPRQRQVAGGGQGTLIGKFEAQTFNGNICVLGGAITFSGGRLETTN
jgi:hypothetical protein